eukprot:SAG31_NODE_5710_length_2368_cov_3.244601_1_plen_335_part_10
MDTGSAVHTTTIRATRHTTYRTDTRKQARPNPPSKRLGTEKPRTEVATTKAAAEDADSTVIVDTLRHVIDAIVHATQFLVPLRLELQPDLDKLDPKRSSTPSPTGRPRLTEMENAQRATAPISPATRSTLFNKYKGTLDQPDAPFATHATGLMRGLYNKSNLARHRQVGVLNKDKAHAKVWSELYVAAWNMSHTSKTQLQLLDMHAYDVTFLSELHSSAVHLTDYSGTGRFLHSGPPPPNDPAAAVAFRLSPRAAACLIDYGNVKGTEGRAMYVRLRAQEYNVLVIGHTAVTLRLRLDSRREANYTSKHKTFYKDEQNAAELKRQYHELPDPRQC